MPQTPVAPVTKVVLTDPTLFGNDAAEDERDEIFYSYALERPELAIFADRKRMLAVARAYKGEGKSALLRLTRHRIGQIRAPLVVVAKTAADLSPEVGRDDYSTWVRAWKASILGMLAVEIGTQIGVAWSDDAMSLVEESEKKGFKRRSLLSSILDRLQLPNVELGGAQLSIPEQRKLGTVNPGEVVKRWSAGKTELWLFVDDVDKNFENTPAQCMRAASFFDACRELGNAIPELRMRSAVRPNVWTILRLQYESLSHLEQYLIDLSWNEADTRQLLARRVRGYLLRTDQWRTLPSGLRAESDDAERALIEFAFEGSMKWGRGMRPLYVVLHTLSKHRPRWVVELAKAAASGAVKRHHNRITHEDIIGELVTFGRRRIEDTVAEFKSQSPEIDELIAAFSREKEQLSTAELLTIIDNRILTHLQPHITGVTGRPSNLAIARLLFEIGLFYGRRDLPDGNYIHFSFSERPFLFKTRTNIDDGLSWEIHPVFRQALELRDSGGQEVGRRRRRK